MRLALIVFAVVLFAGAAQAQSTPPRREDPLQRKLQSVVQLEMLEAAMTRRPSASTDRNTTLAQVREDFWRIQLANDDLNASLSSQGASDPRLISKTASEIRTRAKRLKENLALPHPPKDPEKDSAQAAPAVADLRSSIAALSKLIDSFVSNPMLSQRHVVDATLSLKASRDLEDIIALSGEIKKIAAKLK
jgi:hypothetical protein